MLPISRLSGEWSGRSAGHAMLKAALIGLGVQGSRLIDAVNGKSSHITIVKGVTITAAEAAVIRSRYDISVSAASNRCFRIATLRRSSWQRRRSNTSSRFARLRVPANISIVKNHSH